MTNIVLNVIVLAVLGAVSWPVLRRLRGGPIAGTVAASCACSPPSSTR